MGSYAAAASPHAAIQYDPVTGKIPAFEQRAKRMTQNPFFVPRRTLLVKDVIGATTLASFHLDAGWRQDICSGCSPVVQLRLFDYDAPMHRADCGQAMTRETAWAICLSIYLSIYIYIYIHIYIYIGDDARDSLGHAGSSACQ